MTDEFKTGIVIVAIIELVALMGLGAFSLLVEDYTFLILVLAIIVIADSLVAILYALLYWITRNK